MTSRVRVVSAPVAAAANPDALLVRAIGVRQLAATIFNDMISDLLGGALG